MNSVLGSPESADYVNESPSFSKFVIFRFVLARSLLTSFNVLGIFDMTKIAERSGLGGRLASGMRRVAGNFHSMSMTGIQAANVTTYKLNKMFRYTYKLTTIE